MAQRQRATINFDRGVIFAEDPASKVNVYMYVDEPGIYRNAFEHIVSDDLARAAGFDVEKYAKDRLYRERMAAAKEAIEVELSKASEVVEVEERGGFKVLDIGLGRHNVTDPEGRVLNAEPLPKDIASALLKRLVPGAAAKK